MKGGWLDLPRVFDCSLDLGIHNLSGLYPVPFAMPPLRWPKADFLKMKPKNLPATHCQHWLVLSGVPLLVLVL